MVEWGGGSGVISLKIRTYGSEESNENVDLKEGRVGHFKPF